MRPTIQRTAALAGVAAMALGAIYSGARGEPSKSIAWQTDYKKALALASSQHKIVMIDFYTEG